ncbi:hypothetical protein [Marinomonas aquiplantarum]|uniref:Uncharacterized protein n=1 Tax=Marinomonas aquiplantarum TaxID=491951 RepID=A0A366CYF3_9GAMM|nr:hypothetical protein [Marinomonas aquiplantarum]RBO82655.1 hypothetical protein DFP76_105122 [Marinomonas aquiplantarum]
MRTIEISMKKMSHIENVMGLWKEGFLTNEDVIAWADQQILIEDEPSEALMDLSVKGPEFCSKKPWYEFPSAKTFSFSESFALRASKLDIENNTEIECFIEWLIDASMCEDLELPEVSFGYNVDHYAWNFQLAIKYFKENIQELLPNCRDRANSLGAQYLIKP